MNRAALFTTAAAGAMLIGAGCYFIRRDDAKGAVRAPGSPVIPIISPVIDLRMAEAVLEIMEHLAGDEVTVLLHTQGGCVASCVLISNALRQYEHSTAVVPYMAISGGTMIALNAKRLEMGRNAALSAVDPIISGMRARHLRVEKNDGGLGELAKEYHSAISRYLRETLEARMSGASEAQLATAMATLMGERSPHEWPIRMPEVAQLGIAVEPMVGGWASRVDTYRKRWW